MTAPMSHREFSRRSLFRLGGAIGAGLAFGPALAACAGPTGSPGPGAMTMALNRSLVSLDNKLNQFDAAVTVQRAVRQGLTRIGADLTPELVLAESFQLTPDTPHTGGGGGAGGGAGRRARPPP